MVDFNKSGSSSKNNSSSTTKTQREYTDKAVELYGAELGQNDNLWQGDRVADFSDLQQKSLGYADNFADIFGNPQQTNTPLFGETGSSIANLLSGEAGASQITQRQVDDYFKNTLYDPAVKSLRSDILPSIDEGYAGTNFFNSSRGKARDSAMAGMTDTLITKKSELDWDANLHNQMLEESSANRTLQTLGPAMQYGQQPATETMNNLQIAASQLGGLQDLFGFGQQEQTQEQRELTDSIAKFAEENQITDPENMSILLELLGLQNSTSRARSSSTSWGFGVLS